MWGMAQRYRNAPLNVMIVKWRIKGPLEVAGLSAAITDLIERHSVLRTRLSFTEGQLLQVVEPVEPISLAPFPIEGATPDERLESATARLRAEASTPLDLTEKPPLRVLLLRTAEHDHLLCFLIHHAMCDWWSIRLLTRDLAALYEARVARNPVELPHHASDYADFAASQIRQYESGGFEDEIRYWRSELGEPPPSLELPTLVDRKRVRDWRAECPTQVEPPEIAETLKALGRTCKASLFSVLLTALGVLLYRHTGMADQLIGVSTTNRWTPESMQVVGCFTNLLPARIRLTGSTAFATLATEVHKTVRKLLAYGRIPFDVIVRETQGAIGGAGLTLPIWCQLTESQAAVILRQADVSFEPLVVDRVTMVCELEADLMDSELGLECMFAHRPALFDRRIVGSLMAEYSMILRAAARGAQRQVDELCELAAEAPAES